MKTHHTALFTCLRCGKQMDAHTGKDDKPPETGDLTMCLACGAFMKFVDDSGSNVVLASPADTEKVDRETLLYAVTMHRAWKLTHANPADLN